MIYHIVQPFLSFLILMLICFFQILFNGITCLDSQIIFDDINIFIYFRNLFIFVEESELKHIFSTQILAIDPLSDKYPFDSWMLAVNITDFCIYVWDHQLKDKIFRDPRHHLWKVYFVLFFVDFLPVSSVHLLYFHSFDQVLCDVADFDCDLASDQRDNASKSITEGLIQCG